MVKGRLGHWLAWTRDPEQVRRAALLRRAPLFAGLPRRLLGQLAVRFFAKAYDGGEIVFHQGDPGKALFVVVDGAVSITQTTAHGEHALRTLGPGECFGELALIDDFPRSATARVSVPARLLILYKTDFDALVEGNRAIAVVIMRNLLRALAMYARRPGGPPDGSDGSGGRPS
jgi:CRP-like cAMP-binding protein